MLDGTDGAQFLCSPHTGAWGSSHTRPTTCWLRPFRTNPDTGENRVAAMRYGIDSLMKDNITFSLAPSFLLSHSLNANTKKEKNQYEPGKTANSRRFISVGFRSLGLRLVHPGCWDVATYAPFFTCLFLNNKGGVRRRDDQQRLA